MNSLKIVFSVLFLVLNGFVFGQESQKIFSVAQYQSDKQCAISFTFDDGLEEHYTLVFPKLEALGFKATFWVNGNTINEGELGRMKEKPRTTWKQLREMVQKGHEISNHGWAHKNFGRHSIEQIKEDIVKNDSAIFVNTGIMPCTFAYPNNTKPAEGVKIASENRVGTRLFQRSLGSKSTSVNLKKWVNKLLDDRDWGVTMTHGISYGYDAFKDVTVLWNHLDQVKALEDKIWVGTFREISAYTTEQKYVKLKITQKGEKWMLVPSLSLDKNLFNVPLTMIVNKEMLSECSVKQQGKKLKISNLPDKILFDFDPNGGEIVVRKKH